MHEYWEWAWTQSVTPRDKLLLLALADAVDEDPPQDDPWHIEMPLTDLARHAGLTVTGTRRALRRLADRGFLAFEEPCDPTLRAYLRMGE